MLLLSDAFKCLCFTFEELAYQYAFLPFGLSLSPHVFTKVVKAACAASTTQASHPEVSQ